MKNKRYHIIISSIVFAGLMWISVNLQDEYLIVRHVPVVLEKMKEGKAPKYALPKTVSMSFKGRGWMLTGLYMLPEIYYSIDMSSITEKDYLITDENLMEHVKTPFSLKPFDVKPETIIVALGDMQKKRVPVIVNVTADYKDGYGQVGVAQIAPESVTVSGAKDLLSEISSWPTQYKKFDKLSSSVDMNIFLEEPESYSVDISPPSVKLKVDVQPFAEKTFSGISLNVTDMPPNREVIFMPPRMDIIVRGGIRQLANLKDGDLAASVSYQDLTADSSGTVVPQITAPADVRVIGRVPGQFKFVIRKKS